MDFRLGGTLFLHWFVIECLLFHNFTQLRAFSDLSPNDPLFLQENCHWQPLNFFKVSRPHTCHFYMRVPCCTPPPPGIGFAISKVSYVACTLYESWSNHYTLKMDGFQSFWYDLYTKLGQHSVQRCQNLFSSNPILRYEINIFEVSMTWEIFVMGLYRTDDEKMYFVSGMWTYVCLTWSRRIKLKILQGQSFKFKQIPMTERRCKTLHRP